MFFQRVLFSVFCFVFFCFEAIADEQIAELEVSSALQIGKSQLLGIELSFGDSETFNVKERLSTDITARYQEKAFNRSFQESCYDAMVQALLALQLRADKEGANAVVGIRSDFSNGEFVSDTHFRCRKNNVTASVELKGDAIIIED